MKVNHLILFLSISAAVLGCKNASSDKEEVPNLKPGEVFSKHNASACPVNVVGLYQRLQNSGVVMKQDLLKIYLETKQILTVIPIVNGVEVPSESLYVDGIKKQISNSGPENYRISYCDNFMIVSIGKSFGQTFRTELRLAGNGLVLSNGTEAGRSFTVKYQKINASDYLN